MWLMPGGGSQANTTTGVCLGSLKPVSTPFTRDSMQPFPESTCDCVCWECVLSNTDFQWSGSTSRIDTGDTYSLLGTEVFVLA